MAPVSAGTVGVPLFGMLAAIDPVMGIALPGKGAMATAGLAYAAALQLLLPLRGKYPIPTPMPVLEGAATNPLTALVKASHRVGWTMGVGGSVQASSAAAQFIDPDLSSMMNTSTGTWVVFSVDSPHPPSVSRELP